MLLLEEYTWQEGPEMGSGRAPGAGLREGQGLRRRLWEIRLHHGFLNLLPSTSLKE